MCLSPLAFAGCYNRTLEAGHQPRAHINARGAAGWMLTWSAPGYTSAQRPAMRRPLPLQDLADWNKQYEAKFGHVFLISAAGKTAPQILASLKARCRLSHAADGPPGAIRPILLKRD